MSKIYLFVEDEAPHFDNGYSICICNETIDLIKAYLYTVSYQRLDTTDHQFFWSLDEAKKIPVLEYPMIHKNGKIFELEINDETNTLTAFSKMYKIAFTRCDNPTKKVIDGVLQIKHHYISKCDWVEQDISPFDVSWRALSFVNSEFKKSNMLSSKNSARTASVDTAPMSEFQAAAAAAGTAPDSIFGLRNRQPRSPVGAQPRETGSKRPH